MKRRRFLQLAASAAAGAVAGHSSAFSSSRQFSLRIAPVSVELAPGIVVRTTGYNGQSPGPVLRMREGVPATVSVTNATDVPELMQWHGLHLNSALLGATEEGGPMIPPGATRTYRFTPSPSGTRWYHAHTRAFTHLQRAANSGQSGFLLVEPRSHAGAFDQEVFLAVHHWEPSLLPVHERPGGREIAYRYASFNDKLLGAGEPVRVRAGERVLFHFLNASPTEDVLLHLPGHRFTVVALDGNPVPKPAAGDVLSLAVGERIDAIVEMNTPGNWLLGSLDDAERARGLGVRVEYANQSGSAQWHPPVAVDWSYARFSVSGHYAPEPDQLLEMLLEKRLDSRDGIDHWLMNGRSNPDIEPLFLQEGRRYRLRMMNATARVHPVHLHHHSFELTRINQIPVSGIFKDTIRLDRYNVVEADVVVSHPGPACLHSPQRLVMDSGYPMKSNWTDRMRHENTC
jgi:FtsP/CotA-like multicopper oxidase with cupredoxin domain